MRLPVTALLLLTLAACSDTKKESLTGKWTSVFDAAQPPPPGYSDTFSFYGKDSFSIRLFQEGVLQQDTRGTYKYDSKGKTLSTVSSRGPVTFEVQALTGDTLRLNDGQGGLATFRRVAK
ncbi:MAG: hypothetical protein EOO15_08970 [Chitinophagaceae bacterium]|nr:MAG: hypothetical protein EOO15_08970 [Chitinophagaceae bacterium]